MTTFSNTAMLVSCNVRAYSARKEDKKISREVAETHNTSQDAGRYNKVLVSKQYLEPIHKAAGAIRQYHYENTLPWLDDGVRVLPAANFQNYKADMIGLQDTFDSAVHAFVEQWPAIIEDARQRLNGMFKHSDYPADVRSKFGCGLRFMPIPDADDFRVQIADMERDAMRAQISDTLSEASRAAMRDLWERLSETVGAMAEKLAAYKTVIVDGKPKAENIFRDTLVTNLRDLCELLPRLNFANDPKLEQVRQKIISNLLQSDAPTLRERDSLREDVAAKAASIASEIAEFMV